LLAYLVAGFEVSSISIGNLYLYLLENPLYPSTPPKGERVWIDLPEREPSMSESENSNPSKKARSNRASSADQTKDDEAIFKIADWGMEKHFLIHSGKRAADAVEGWPRLIARDNDTRALSKLHLLASEVVKSRGDQFEVVESPSLKLAYYYSPNTLGFVSDKPLPKTWKLDRTPLGQKVLDALRVDYHALQAQYPMHRMSAIYEVFVKITNALPLFVSEGPAQG